MKNDQNPKNFPASPGVESSKPGVLHLEETGNGAMLVRMEGRKALLALMVMRSMESYPLIANIILTGAACYCKKNNLSFDQIQKVVNETDFDELKL